MALYKILSVFIILLSVSSSNVLSMMNDRDEVSQERTPLRSAPKLKSKWGCCAFCCHDEDVEVHPKYYQDNPKQIEYLEGPGCCEWTKQILSCLTCFIFPEPFNKVVTYDGEKMALHYARGAWRQEVNDREQRAAQARYEAHEKEMKDIDHKKETYKGEPISTFLKYGNTRNIDERTLAELQKIYRDRCRRDYEEEGKKPEVQQKRREEAECKRREEEARRLRERPKPYMYGNADQGDPASCYRCDHELSNWISKNPGPRGSYATSVSPLTQTYWLNEDQARRLIEDIKSGKLKIRFEPSIKFYGRS